MFRISEQIIVDDVSAFTFAIFAFIIFTALLLISTKYAYFAPRDKASIPTTPEPAKQSKTTLSLKNSPIFLLSIFDDSNMSNKDWRALDKVALAD